MPAKRFSVLRTALGTTVVLLVIPLVGRWFFYRRVLISFG